jgi:hypothetical protein
LPWTIFRYSQRHSRDLTEQAKLKGTGYSDFVAFVRDVARIFHNAKIYNDRGSEIYQDACKLEVSMGTHGF